MKTWRLVSGILSIVLAAFVIFQASAVSLANTLAQNGDISGGAGMIVAFLMLAGGIVSIVLRKGSTGGNIAILIIFGIAAWLAFAYKDTYPDLLIWGSWCVVCAFLGWLCAARQRGIEHKNDPNRLDVIMLGRDNEDDSDDDEE